MHAYFNTIDAMLKDMLSLEDFILSMRVSIPFPDDMSHALVRIEPTCGVRRPWSKAHTEFASDYIAQHVFEWVLRWKPVEIPRSITALLQHSDTSARGYGGVLFEQAVHHAFRAGIRLHPEGFTEGAPPLAIDILRADGEEINYFRTLPVWDGKESQNVESRYLRQYMTLIPKMQKSVDAVWLSEDAAVFFRITVEPCRGVGLRGIEQLVEELPGGLRDSVYVVSVVPADNRDKEDFEQQSTYSVGTSRVQMGEGEGYPQYLFYFDLVKMGFLVV